MKAAPLILLCVVLSLGAGAVGSLLGSEPPTPAPVSGDGALSSDEVALLEAWRAADREGPTQAPAVLTAGESRRLTELEAEVEALREELAAVREARHRQPAVTQAPETASAPVTSIARDTILQVMEEEEAREEAEREREREERRERQLQERATELAREAGIDEHRSTELAEVLRNEEQKRREAWEIVRAMGGDDTRDLMRTAFEDVTAWKRTELTSRFGAEAADKVVELSTRRGRDRGGRGGRGR